MAEGLVEAGGKVHVLDRVPEPDTVFLESAERMKRHFGGELVYHQADVSDENGLEKVVADIAAERQRLDGLIAGTISTLYIVARETEELTLSSRGHPASNTGT